MAGVVFRDTHSVGERRTQGLTEYAKRLTERDRTEECH